MSAILLAIPFHYPDLAGYDDALFAHIAKDILKTGDWLNVRSNGYPALEHPPMLAWMEAALFRIFGVSDAAARAPSILSGFGTILLVYWLARRLLRDRLPAVLAMLIMAGTLYFLKYAARAMTDVPFTFFFLSAICAWSLAEEDPRWYLAAGLFTALAAMTRGLMGVGLPVIFLIHLVISRQRPPLRLMFAALAIAAAPSAFWYASMISAHGNWFFGVHSAWLDREVYGSLSPPWRRFTGHFEYVLMIAKSYWPWLPFMLIGPVVIIRRREQRLYLLLIWIAVVFLMCGAARSRVLRYMLPAYPAFAILAAIGIQKVFREHHIVRGLRTAAAVFAIAVVALALFARPRQHAEVVRPIALAATAATMPQDRVFFYDKGQPRYDETNQMQWYGDRYLEILLTYPELSRALRLRKPEVMVVDGQTYAADIEHRLPNRVIARSGHLVCVRVWPALDAAM